ncbi:MAG: hypothetical protein M5U25_04485 [Planctomycetota bacterium]|nr:hypothetical protein [Planctomycetota bacterium]
MKRYPVFALVALVFLLLVLLGSWVYLKNYAWPGADSPTARETGKPAGREPTEDLFANEAAAPAGSDTKDNTEDRGDSSTPPPEEPAETRPTPPPEPVETGPKPQPQASVDKPKDTIVAELKLTKAGVRGDGETDEGLDPFIVSTLESAKQRESVTTVFDEISWGRLADDGAVIQSVGNDAPEPKRFLQGRLLWPALTSDQQTELKNDQRNQAVVYLDRLPEFRAVVFGKDGRFALPVTERMEADFGSKGLRIVVHSPIYEIEGGFEALLVKKDDGPIRIQLQLAPVLEVTVDVSPPEAIAAGVRVWLERRGLPGTPDFDDSLYMSAKVPDSGRLVFKVPERYGELRVGATGPGWHSGGTELIKLRNWKTAAAKVSLTLIAERCDRVSGRAVDEKGNSLGGVRLESTHYGTTVYTGAQGEFAMYVPFQRGLHTRQFIAWRHHVRPEVVPLETGRDGSPGVEGVAPYGPFTIRFVSEVEVELQLPAEIHATASVHSGRFKPAADLQRAGRGVMRGELQWGTGMVRFSVSGGSERQVVTWISAEEWEQLFRAYAAGTDAPALSAEMFEDAFKKR